MKKELGIITIGVVSLFTQVKALAASNVNNSPKISTFEEKFKIEKPKIDERVLIVPSSRTGGRTH